MDRSAINRALAKAIAFKNAGNEDAARAWGRELMKLLELEGILGPELTTRSGYR